MKSMFALCALTLASGTATASPVDRFLYPPELIMEAQFDIDLKKDQRTRIKEEMKRGQAVFLDLKWQVREEAEKLSKALSQERINEKTALAQAKKLMSIEHRIKQTRLAMLIRIKNALTAEQQAKLQQIKRKHDNRPRRDRRPRRPPRPPTPPER